MDLLLIGLAIYLVVANVWVTRHVWRDSRRTNDEKIAETGLIWIVPFFGHLISLAISRDDPALVRKSDPAVVGGGVVAAIAGTGSS